MINLLNSSGCLINLFELNEIKTSKRDGSYLEESINHLVECTWPGIDGKGCIIGTNTWVPTLIPKNVRKVVTVCQELERKRCSAVGDLPSVIEAEGIEQYGHRENVRIFDVDKDQGEDVLAEVVKQRGPVSQSLQMYMSSLTKWR